MSESRLIVGLGNPGKNYEHTRHNLGFQVVQCFARQQHLRLRQSSLCKGLTSEGKIADQQICLLLPLTFMNNSGVAVKRIAEEKDIAPENILVVCDDLNLDFSQLRVRRKGSDGGHNGLKSIIYHLGVDSFARVRLGIGNGSLSGRKSKENDVIDFVLEEFSREESKHLENFIEEGAGCCLAWLTEEMEQVMNQFNKRRENE